MEATQLVNSDNKQKNPTTLFELLAALSAADDAMGEFDFAQSIDLLENGRVKVDNYKFILDKLDAQEIILDKRAKEYSEARRVVAANRDRLERHLVHCLQQNGFDQFAGYQYKVKLSRGRPSVEIKGVSKPTPAMKIKYPDYSSTKYEWDKDAIGHGLKSGDAAAAELAALKDSYYAKFSIIKDVE